MFGLFTFDKKIEIAFKIQFKFSSIMVFFSQKNCLPDTKISNFYRKPNANKISLLFNHYLIFL